jgi:type IV pilus assembly protein PilY1
MRNYQSLLNRALILLGAATLVTLSGIAPVSAMDTDVYLMSPTVARDDSPNVMIILDNSGSMSTVISNTRPAYDPSIDYCTGDLDTLTGIVGANGGKPSNCSSISGRVFWSFSSNLPSTFSNNWFTSSKNKCLDSATALSVSGSYGSTKIVGYVSGTGWRSLSGRQDGDFTYVDCEADGTTDGQTAGDNTFPRKSNSAYTSISSQEFNWSNFTSNDKPVLYSRNYVNYWNNSALLTSKTRLNVAKDAVKSIIDTNTSVRFGLTVFNTNNSSPDGGRVLMRIDTMSDTRRTTMKNIVDGLTASTNTPLAETMWEAYRYFGGHGVTYGNPSPVQTPHQDSCAQNITNSACNNGGTYDAIAAGDPSYNDGTYISPFRYGCQTAYIIYVTDGDPTNDSAANSNIASLIGASCDGSGCLDDLSGWIHDQDIDASLTGKQTVKTYTIGFGGGISAAGLALLQQTASKGGGTYYNANDADQLASALQGAISDILQTTASFTAPSLSINAFNKLYNRDDVYFALFKPSASQAWDGNIKRYRLCNASDVTAYGCTFGEVIDVNNVAAIDTLTSKIKPTAVSYWGTTADGSEVNQGGAGAQITQNSVVPRTLYTYRGAYTGVSSSAPATPVAVVATAGNSVYDAAVTDPIILGLPATATSTDVSTLINWMRGQDAYDRNGNGNTAETRAWNFSDPLHSRPVTMTFGCVGSGPCTSTSTPIIKLFVGSNDGTIRIINNGTGAEEWAFIPQELLGNQYALAQDADGDHIYGPDDSPAFMVYDLNNDGIIDPAVGDKVYMYIGMRRGGRNIYAFDMTPSAKMTSQSDTLTPKLIWAIQGGTGNFANLGQTWSRPLVARIRAKCTGSVCDDGNPATNDSQSRMVLILGGGYDTNEDNAIPAGTDSMGNAIYIVDPFTGQRIWWASSDTSASLVLSNMRYAIPSEIAAVDSNNDKSVDRLYVGDLSGQVWRVDLGDQIGAASNDGSTGYVFADVGCTGGTRLDCSATTNQNRRKFFYPPDVSQVDDPNFSTSQFYDLVTIASGDREDPLDLLTTNLSPIQGAVHNRIYAFRDYDYTKGAPASMLAATPTTPSAISESVMYDATADLLGSSDPTVKQAAIDSIRVGKGWYIDLKEANSITLTNGLNTQWVGEKSLAKTLIYSGTLYVTTFVPANDSTAVNTCQANEGEGRYYALNYLTGTAAFDLNGNNTIDTLDRSTVVGGGIPSEVIVVIRDVPPGSPVNPTGGPGGGCNGGVTAMVGTSGGAAGAQANPCTPRYKTFWYDE